MMSKEMNQPLRKSQNGGFLAMGDTRQELVLVEAVAWLLDWTLWR